MPAPLPLYATPGTVLAGKYALSSVLGRGGMGVVLEAEHLALGKRVAVKLLLSEADATSRARFQLEARAAALISSPHVAQVLDFGFIDDGRAFLVMEYLVGRDLHAERRARERLEVEEAIDIILEASVGLAEAHAIGLVHRDIKPANIFLANVGGRRVVKILDFGLIKVIDDGPSLTNSTETFGTPKYMAPEQLRAARDVDERADQHSLAAVLFELITGHAPFEGESVPDIIVKVCTEAAPLMWSMGVSVPQPVDDAVQRALMKSPDDRYPNLAELTAALAPFGGPRAAELAAQVAAVLAKRDAQRAGGAMLSDLRRAQGYAPRLSSPSHPGSARSQPGVAGLAPRPETYAAVSADRSSVSSFSSVDASTRRLAPPFERYDQPPQSTVGSLSAGSLASARVAAAERAPTHTRAALIMAAIAGIFSLGTIAVVLKVRSSGADHPSTTSQATETTLQQKTFGVESAKSAAAPPSASVFGTSGPSLTSPAAEASLAPSAVATTSGALPPFSHRQLGPPKTSASHAPTTTSVPPTAPTACDSLDCLEKKK